MSEGEVVDGELVEPEEGVDPHKRVSSHKPAGDVAAYEPPPVPANPFDADPERFKVQLAQRGENYAALVDWLVDNLVMGEDVVQVHVVKREHCDYAGPPPKGDCSPMLLERHWSDPDIGKKGAEKICGLLGLGTRFLGMEDFKKAALKGYTIEHVIIDCELYNVAGVAVSQGTGACSLTEVQGNLNSAMKKACKRAHVDAVKRCAGLSGLATEIKKRMGPPDPDEAARHARDAGARARRGGGREARGAEKPTVCPIGASKGYKGKRWSEIPIDFLEWIVRSIDDKPGLVEAATEEIKRRREAARPTEPEAPPREDFDDDIPY